MRLLNIETLASLRKFLLLFIFAPLIAIWVLSHHHGNKVELFALLVAGFSAFTTYLVSLAPSIRIELRHPERGKLISPFVLQNLSNVGGTAKVLVVAKADGKLYSAKRLKDEKYYSWKSKWDFSGQESIQGYFDVAKLLPGRAMPDHLGVQITVQWYTTFGLPVDKLYRYWTFDKDAGSWVLDVGGMEFRG